MKRNVYLLGLTSLLNDLSSEGIYALLPLLLKDPGLVGFIGGLFNGFAYVIKPFSGYLSDRIGRAKPFVVAGYLISSVSKVLIAFLSGIQIAAAVVLDRIGKGVRDAPRDALLAENEERGWAFAVHRALDTTGAVLGVLAAALLTLWMGLDPRRAIFLLALVSFLAVVPLLFVLERKREKNGGSVGRFVKESVKELGGTLPVVVLVGLSLITPALFIERAEEMVGGSGILLYAVFNVIYVISAYYLGKKSDLWGRRKVLAIGLASTVVSLALLALSTPASVSLAFVLYGVAFGTVVPVIFARGGDRVKREHRGTGMGLLQAAFGLSILLSSTVAGFLVKAFGSVGIMPFTLPAILALLTIRRF